MFGEYWIGSRAPRFGELDPMKNDNDEHHYPHPDSLALSLFIQFFTLNKSHDYRGTRGYHVMLSHIA
jgi:hypothetical protein